MSEQEVFILADQALKNVVDQIKDEQGDMVMPPEFEMRSKPGEITLRTVINYHAYDEAWVPDTLSGKTMEEVGKDKFDGDLLGADSKASYAKLVELGIAAVRALDDPERITHLTYGDYPAREYLAHITSFRGLRAHDIAKVIGVSTKLPDDLVQGMWDLFSPTAEEWRKMGVFKAKVEVPEDASLQNKLLGMTGRQPDSE